jgi:tRNA (guanine-N7-)-methyltransferase
VAETLDRTTEEYRDHIRTRRRLLREKCAALLAAQPAFVWEIGCGHGHFLTGYAAEHGDRLCLGIDVIHERIERAERKRARAHLTNLHFLHADSSDFLAALPANAVFMEIYVLFPDPWPKRRHWKNRLIDAAFLQAAARRTGQGSRLYFRTDHEPYFLEVAALLQAHPAWQTRPNALWPFELPTVFQKRASLYHSLVAERI